MLRHVIGGGLLALLISSPVAAEPKWVEAAGKTCPEACVRSSLIPVAAGKFTDSDNDYYVCAAPAHGLRPGYNLSKSAAPLACNVGHDSKEKGLENALCLCHSKRVAAE